jgi:hypothetical protein
MFDRLHRNRVVQLLLGLMAGIAFGFFLQKGGATDYTVIMNQLLLTDFTVVKIMLTAVATGMIGIHLLRIFGLARLQPKTGSLGSSVIGGLIFGVGFGLLGYCPGTVAGAVGEGRLDALVSGVTGILIGAWIFAAFYPALSRSILVQGDFGDVTLPQLFKVNVWTIVIPASFIILVFLILLEWVGL